MCFDVIEQTPVLSRFPMTQEKYSKKILRIWNQISRGPVGQSKVT